MTTPSTHTGRGIAADLTLMRRAAIVAALLLLFLAWYEPPFGLLAWIVYGIVLVTLLGIARVCASHSQLPPTSE